MGKRKTNQKEWLHTSLLIQISSQHFHQLHWKRSFKKTSLQIKKKILKLYSMLKRSMKLRKLWPSNHFIQLKQKDCLHRFLKIPSHPVSKLSWVFLRLILYLYKIVWSKQEANDKGILENSLRKSTEELKNNTNKKTPNHHLKDNKVAHR